MAVDNALRSRTATARLTRVIVVAILGVAVLWTLSATVWRTVGLVVGLGSGTVAATLVADSPLPASAASPHLASGTWSAVDVVARDLPGGVLALTGLAGAADLLAHVALGAVLVLLCVRVLRAEPFAGAMAVQVVLGGAAVAIGAIVAIGAGVLRDWTLADLLSAPGLRLPTSAAADPTLLPVGLGLLVLGLLLDHGRRLETATDGLV